MALFAVELLDYLVFMILLPCALTSVIFGVVQHIICTINN